MSVEAITDTIHEYLYEKMNESRDSEEETKIKYVDIKTNYQKPENKKPNKFRKVDCIRCGALEQTTRLPGKTKKCLKCRTIGHYAKLCWTKQTLDRKIKHIVPESEATSAEGDGWSPNKIYHITRTVHSITRDGQPFLTTTALVNMSPIKFIIDSGLTVTLIPKQMFNEITPKRPLHTENRDVNNNKIKIEERTSAKVETNGATKKIELPITTKRTNPLLGLDWMN